MKLTNEDLDVIRELLINKLKQNQLSITEDDRKSEDYYVNLIKKLDSMYFI